VERLQRLFVAVAVAVAVSGVAAGPAAAAKGGNSDNAHACQQGGHKNSFEAETGHPFKNAGDCASHGAQGGVSAGLFIQTFTPQGPDTYPCDGGTCWGHIIGSGLEPFSKWDVIFDTLPIGPSGVVGQSGDVNEPINQLCQDHFQGLQAIAQTALGQTITSDPVNSPC
jgi:hypothetical protein